MLGRVSHSTDCSNFVLALILIEDLEHEFFISFGESFIRWYVSFLVVVVISTEGDDNKLRFKPSRIPYSFFTLVRFHGAVVESREWEWP